MSLAALLAASFAASHTHTHRSQHITSHQIASPSGHITSHCIALHHITHTHTQTSYNTIRYLIIHSVRLPLYLQDLQKAMYTTETS